MKKKIVFIALLFLIILPLFSCENENYGYEIKLNSNNTIDLKELKISVLDEYDNPILSDLESGTTYKLKTVITGKNNTNEDIATYKMSIEMSNPMSYVSFVEGDTSSEVISGKVHTFNFSIGRYDEKSIDKNIICSFNVSKSMSQNDISKYVKYSFYECSILNLKTSFSINTTSIERFSNDSHEYLRFLAYPQTKVTDESLIDDLESYTRDNIFDTIFSLNGNIYFKAVGIGFYKVEPILWRVLYHVDNTYVLMSEYVLYSSSFENLEDTDDLYTLIKNSTKVYGNDFDMMDNLTIKQALNIKELTNEDYKFTNSSESDIERQAYATDYAKVLGVPTSDEGTANYWTSSTSLYFTDSLAYYVTKSGALESLWKASISKKYGVRPIITVEMEEK